MKFLYCKITFKIILFTCLILITAVDYKAQTKQIDSIRVLLKQKTSDTSRISHLFSLAEAYVRILPDSALAIYQHTLKLSESTSFHLFKARANHNVGRMLANKSDYNGAIQHYNEAIGIYEQAEEKSSGAELTRILNYKAKTLGNLAIVYTSLGDFKPGLEYAFKALEINERSNNRSSLSSNLNTIGNIYSSQGNYSEALHHYFRALKIDESIGALKNTSYMLTNIAVIFMEQKKYPQALAYAQKARIVSKNLNDNVLQSTNIGNIGDVYYLQKNYDFARYYYELALHLDDSSGYMPGIARHTNNLGTLYSLKKDAKKTLNYLLRSLQISRELGLKKLTSITLTGIGSVYIEKGKLSEASRYLNEAKTIAEELSLWDELETAHRQLAILDSAKGNYSGAYEHYKLHILYRDSLNNDESTRKSLETEFQYSFGKKAAADSTRNAEHIKLETLKHDEEIKQQRILTYGGLVGFILMMALAGISFRAYRNKRNANAIISDQKHVIEEKHKEILDSIRYAKRIQVSLLPPDKYIEKTVKRLKNKT